MSGDAAAPRDASAGSWRRSGRSSAACSPSDLTAAPSASWLAVSCAWSVFAPAVLDDRVLVSTASVPARVRSDRSARASNPVAGIASEGRSCSSPSTSRWQLRSRAARSADPSAPALRSWSSIGRPRAGCCSSTFIRLGSAVSGVLPGTGAAVPASSSAPGVRNPTPLWSRRSWGVLRVVDPLSEPSLFGPSPEFGHVALLRDGARRARCPSPGWSGAGD